MRTRARGRLGPLGEPLFRRLWFARSTSALGDALVPVATSFAVLELGSASDLGFVLGAYMGSRMLFVVVGGVWADRLPRQLVMVSADVVRAGTHGLVAIAFVTEAIAVWHLAVSSAVFGLGSAFFGPASTGLVPEIVSPGRLQQANALLGLSRSSIDVFGPAVSGVLVATVDYSLIYAIDAATFVVSALFLIGVRAPRPGAVRTAVPFATDLKDGAREVLARPWLQWAFMSFALGNLAMAPYWVLGPVVVEEQLGGPRDWGLMMTGGALGGILGGAIALHVRPARPLLVSFPVMLFLPLQMTLLAVPVPLPLLVAGAALVVVGIVVGNTLWQTTVQQHVPNDKLARVDSLDWMVSLVFMPLGYVLAGPLAERIGVAETLLLASALAVVAKLGIVTLPSVRAIRRLDAPAVATPAHA